MKKQLKTLIIVVAVLAVLTAAYFIVKPLLTGNETGDDKLYVINGKEEAMFAVKVEYPESKGGYRYIVGKIPNVDNTMLYVFQDNGVDDMYDYSQSLLSDAFTRMMKLEARELVFEESDDLTQFGLDDEHAIRVTATPFEELAAKDETLKPIVLLIGDFNALANGYYVKVADKPEIYTITDYYAGTFINGSLRYRALDLIPDFGNYYDNLFSVTLHNFNGETIVLERNQSFESQEEGVLIYSSFTMTEPYVAYADDSVVGEQFLDLLSQLMVAEAVENNPKDLSIYGLDDANSCVVDLKTMDGKEISLRVGAHYVMPADGSTVYYHMGTNSFGALTPSQLRSGLVWLHDIKTVSKIELSLPNGDYVIEINDTYNTSDGSGAFVGTIDGKALSEDNGRRLFSSIIGIQYDDMIVGAPIEDTPSYTLRVTYRSGYTQVLRLYKASSRQYVICLGEDTVPGETNFCANVTYLRKITENIDTILAGGTISR